MNRYYLEVRYQVTPVDAVDEPPRIMRVPPRRDGKLT